MNYLGSATTATQQGSNFLFDCETGMIKPHFKQQLDLVGIVSRRYFEDKDPYHISNVEKELQTKGCLQSDFDFYKKGGESAFKLTYEQAIQFLNDDYAKREKKLPEPFKGAVDGIVCSGVTPDSIAPTLLKRLKGLDASIDESKITYKAIYVLCKDREIVNLSQKCIGENYGAKFKEIDFRYIEAGVEKDIGLTCLKKLQERKLLGNHYVVITDGTSAEKDLLTAQGILKDYSCLGIASDPIKDWKEEMNLYGYEVALGSSEKATIAWARSSWNFIARQANKELSAYRMRHYL